ncbi:MAG: MerR family transcriptional regulator [Clostridia bacterium]|nr:MerR family transcriptional regulator [Clostridia bacterium]
MLLHEVLRRTGLTRKAVEYYIAQGLLTPKATENGYREFSETDVSRLEKIAAYRKLGVSVADIKNILDGNEKQVLSRLLLKRTLDAQREERKLKLMEALASGASIAEISAQLSTFDAHESIANRLFAAFPGYFGQYFALHFAHFLQEPIETDAQRKAYDTIVKWLDNLPPLDLPDDLCAFLDDAAQDMNAQQMGDMHAAVLAASENPEAYLREHEDAIRAYMAIKDTEEYKFSPAARLMEHMKEFQQQIGYIDVFLPAMEELSLSYAIYRERLKAADDAFVRVLSK